MPPVPVALHLWAPVSDEAHVIAGAAHVDAHHVTEPRRGSPASGGNHSPRRPRADRGEGSTTNFVRRGHPSGTGRKKELSGEPSLRKPLLEPIEVSHDGRTNERVDQRGRDPFEFRWLRIDLVRERYELDGRILVENQLAGAALVDGIEERMEEHHRNRGDAERPQANSRFADSLLVEGHVNVALCREPLGDLEPNPTSGDLSGTGNGGIPDVLFETSAELDLIAESLCDEQAGGSPGHLNQGVVGRSRAVNDRFAPREQGLGTRKAFDVGELTDAGENTLGLILGGRGRFLQDQCSVGSHQHAVSERSTHVDADSVRPLGH